MVDFVEHLAEQRLVAIVRGSDPQRVQAACITLLAAGVRCIEVPLTTPNAINVITHLREHADPDTLIGAGTVLTEADVTAIVRAGAQFVVTPALAPSIQAAVTAGLPVLAGAFSPSEVLAAHNVGAAAVKIFPASTVGPSYFKALHDPFPQIPLIAVGGVGVNEAKAYLAAGAAGVGVGGPLIGDALLGGNLDALETRAKQFLRVLT